MRVHASRSAPDRAVIARRLPHVPAHRLLELQRTAGNRAVARHLRSSRTLARKWNAEAEHAISLVPAKPPVRADEFAELARLIEAYRNVPDTEVSATTLALLQSVAKQVVLIRECDDVKDEQLRKTLAGVLTAARQEEDLAKYRVQRGATTEAFKGGVPSYLNITPEPGGREALATGDRGRYPTDVPLDQQFRVGAPADASRDLDIDITGPGGEIDLLVVSGGHGGVGSIFEGATETEHLEDTWWKKQAEALAAKNVTAKLIVLDACLTASMVPAFLPMLAPGGKIIGYVHSIPQMTMTAEVWAEVVKQGPSEIEKIIDQRLAKLQGEHSKSRQGTGLEKTVAVAIYRADRKALHYDQAALDPAMISQLPHAKERGELGHMGKSLDQQKARAHTGYAPSIATPESGSPVTSAAKVVPKAEWGQWLDSVSFMGLTAPPAVKDSVYYGQTGAEWAVTASDADSFTITLA